MPNLGKGRDHSELQDMYRRALAASWAAQPGELPADQCIEDIFSGGDGWKEGGHAKSSMPPNITHDSEDDLRKHHRNVSNGSMKSQSTIKGTTRLGHKHSRSRDMGRHAADQSPNETSEEGSERGRPGFKRVHEVDEFDIRDDLVAWALPGAVAAS